MTAHITEMSCRDFADALAAKRSVPGGGGAAALAGALGVALCSMAGNFTLGKPAYASVEEDVEHMLVRAEAVRSNLMALVNEDARSFEPLAAAYRIPKTDPARRSRIEDATRGACQVPFKIMEQSVIAIELLEEMARKGSAFMISDVGCGAALCSAALQAARLTVLVNTEALGDDDPVAHELDRKADEMIGRLVPRADAVVADVTRRLRKEV